MSRLCDTLRLFVGLLAELHKKIWPDLAEIFWEGLTWLNSEVIKIEMIKMWQMQ